MLKAGLKVYYFKNPSLFDFIPPLYIFNSFFKKKRKKERKKREKVVDIVASNGIK